MGKSSVIPLHAARPRAARRLGRCGGLAAVSGRKARPIRNVAAISAVPANPAGFVKIRAPSAYCGGAVPLRCFDLGGGNYAALARIPGLPGTAAVSVKGIDAKATGIDPVNNEYDLGWLAGQLPAASFNLAALQRQWAAIAPLKAAMQTRKLTPAEADMLKAGLAVLNVVDIHFLSCEFVRFLQKAYSRNNVIDSNVVISCHGVPKLDNAFFTGRYMVYGEGDREFYPLGATDVVGHELHHGFVQAEAGADLPGHRSDQGLVYKGHAGALNESFADIGGNGFEAWLVKKYAGDSDPTNDLPGVADDLMGEDIGRAMPYLRNMANPTAAARPQPGVYRGPYWGNPNVAADEGNVHQNSGPSNRAFVMARDRLGATKARQIFRAALRRLPPMASYIDYRDALKPQDPAMGEILAAVGLGPAAVSDWNRA